MQDMRAARIIFTLKRTDQDASLNLRITRSARKEATRLIRIRPRICLTMQSETNILALTEESLNSEEKA